MSFWFEKAKPVDENTAITDQTFSLTDTFMVIDKSSRNVIVTKKASAYYGIEAAVAAKVEYQMNNPTAILEICKVNFINISKV